MTLLDLMQIIDTYYCYISDKLPVDNEGWPIFKEEHFLNDWPNDIITFENRNNNLITSKSETVLCFYTGDIQNFRRFTNLKNDISIYKEYKGVVMPDITITRDMDFEMQEMIMLANQLFVATLVVNNIKIIFNTRNGTLNTLNCFKHVPRHVMCASGFLGCDNSSDIFSSSPYVNKILRLMPSKLLIYGKHDYIVDQQLESLGINYRYYSDFHTRSLENFKLKGEISNVRL